MSTLPSYTSSQWEGTLTQPMDRWLAYHGFRFNPFVNLEASFDPYLYRYMVHLNAFDALWHNQPTLVFEPRGGGKTTLHIRILQTCYTGQATNRPFPISYFPFFLQWGHTQPTLEDHLQAILTSGAKQLLITLLYRPHWFLRLDQSDRQMIVALLNRDLPGQLNHYLQLLSVPNALDLVQRSLRVSPVIRLPSNHANLAGILSAILELPQVRDQSSLAMRWEKFAHVILNILKLDSIYLLIDGLDAVQETASDSMALINACKHLWQRVDDWANEKVFVKAFLPSEAQGILFEQHKAELHSASIANVEWSSVLLQQMLTERVIAATDGATGGLYALAQPDLQHLEEQIIEIPPRLPREVLSLTTAILNAHVQRSGVKGKLDQGDFLHGVEQYRQIAARVSM